MSLRPIEWRDGELHILDQQSLPLREEWLVATTWQQVAEAISTMALRGAPLIGVAAAFGMALAQRSGADLTEAKAGLAATRPTAVNLFWALERVGRAEDMLAEAIAIEQEEIVRNAAIASNGADLIPRGARVLTVCNTGSLATPGMGTALGIIREAHRQGKVSEVFACETRPRMQGLRLTAYELAHDHIPFRAIADGAAAWLMKRGMVDIVIAGADRIAVNGDSANKIGTYSLAVAAHTHKLPFVIAAPTSTIDIAMPNGEAIEIEERTGEELTVIDGVRIAPDQCSVYNPAFDVTPHELISHIVTEDGVFSPPYSFGVKVANTVNG